MRSPRRARASSRPALTRAPPCPSRSLFWFSTYVIICAVNGSFPWVTESDAPSRLFTWGGVLGMQRQPLEVTWRVFCGGVFGMTALGGCDILYARHTQARYFALHVICNAWISLLCLPDLLYVVSDPVNALKQRETVNHWPSCLVFSIHLYHMLFFKNLQWIDWLHHILMVVIGAPLLVAGEMGHLMNFNHFFMCGVPGGLDYAMLFAVKHGWMDPLDEKKFNSAINVWVREPALVVTAAYGYLQIHLQGQSFSGWVTAIRVFLCLLATWNGLFFMERVVGNYHVCNYKAKLAASGNRGGNGPGKMARRWTSEEVVGGGEQQQPAKGGSDAAGGEAFSYESEEHFTGSLPMVGMRVSVSAQDLQQINKAKDAAAAAAGGAEPYPVESKKGL